MKQLFVQIMEPSQAPGQMPGQIESCVPCGKDRFLWVNWLISWAKSKTGALKRIVGELLVNELLVYTIPDKPNSRLQKHRLTEKGWTSWQNKRRMLVLMKSNMKPQMNELVQATIKLAVAQQQLARQAEQQYSVEVDSILRDQCSDPRHIERLLDGMLDFCFDEGMLRLYKKLCRYYFKIDQMATVSYVYAYREMWDEEEDFKNVGNV